MIVDCETRIWDLSGVNMEDPKVKTFWNKMKDHEGILTGYRGEIDLVVGGDDLVAMMDRNGIDHACVTAFEHKAIMGEEYDATTRLVEAMHKHPDRLTSYVSVSPLQDDWEPELERWVEAGIRAISIYPPQGFYPDEKLVYPLYEFCENNGIGTIFTHAGLLSVPHMENKFAQPLHLDAPARDFPGINFVGEHFGYPWEHDLIAMAWKHRNVYICCTYLGAMLPWAPGDFYHAYGRALRDIGNSKQIVWGSDWVWWSEESVAAQLAALKELQIPEDMRQLYGYPEITPEIRADLLGGAAAELLNLPQRSTASHS